ncbi:MAG: thiol-disulfide oxidoreductase DCC family protein [Nocardioidaceae bacterium]
MTERPTFVFDGDCAFCSSTARALQRWVGGPADVVAWQRADLAALGLTAAECEAAVQWVDDARRSAGALAFADYLRSAGRRWALLGRLLALPSVQVVARPVYAWISRHRHQLPGGTPACKLDPPH